MSAVLAVDLGGSSLRAAVVEESGRIRDLARTALALPRGADGASEVDPEAWWQALAGLLGGLDLGGVAGVAICGFTRTQVWLDAEDRAVGPALTFRDTRAGAKLSPAARAAGLSAYDPLARLLWLKAEAPDRWARVARVVDPKDWLALRLTGRAASDAVSLHGLLDAYASGTAAALGIDRDLRPEILTPGDVLGAVRRAAFPALAGVPVFCGAMDTWAAVLGMGAMARGRAYVLSGTTEVTGLLAAAPAEAPGLLTRRWDAGLWQIGGPGQNGAAALRWAAGRLALDADPAAVLTATADRPRRPLLFLPFLDGERTPFWDADLRAAFLGLSSAHGAGDMLWAVAEGLAFHARLVLGRAEAAAGRPAERVHFAGGGADLPALARLRADALDRPVTVPAEAETGLAGAAILAFRGLGRRDAADALAAGQAAGRTHAPDPARAAALGHRFALWEEAVAATAPLSRRLAALDRGA